MRDGVLVGLAVDGVKVGDAAGWDNGVLGLLTTFGATGYQHLSLFSASGISVGIISQGVLSLPKVCCFMKL